VNVTLIANLCQTQLDWKNGYELDQQEQQQKRQILRMFVSV